MAVDSVSLLAKNLYNQIQNRPKVNSSEIGEAVSFQNLVKDGFNNFAKMTPAQILNHIQEVKNLGASSSGTAKTMATDYAPGVMGQIRGKIGNHEDVLRKSLINEASLVDILTTTTEATNTIKTIVEVRNKFMESFEKIMSLSV